MWGDSAGTLSFMRLGNQDSPYRYNGLKFDAGVLAIGDIELDGAPDLVVSDGISQAKILWTGIAQPTLISLGLKPCSAAVKDLNHDQKPDVILSHAQGVSVALSMGNGSFLPLSKYTSTTGGGPVAIADINGDGEVDIVLASSALPAKLAVFRGRGDGSFSAAVQTDLDTPIVAIAVSDLNGDLQDDLVLNGGPSSQPATTVLISKGDGHFFPPTRFPGLGVAIGNGANDVSKTAIADDFNGDKLPDLALLFGSNLLVWTGNGTGSFAGSIDTDLGQPVGSFILADVNNDKRLDLITTHDDSVQIGVSLGRTGGRFDAPKFFALPSNPYPPQIKMQVVATDLNADGKLDLYVLKSRWDQIKLLGDGAGGFARDLNFGGPGSAFDMVQQADLDEDQKPDFIVVFDTDMGIIYGNDSMMHSFQALNSESALGTPHIVDLNGDHHLDALISSLTSVYVLIGEGAPTGNLNQTERYTPLPPSTTPLKLIVGDFNGDHKPDILVSSDRARIMLLGNGDGTFTAGQPISTTGELLGTAADTNGDGYQDAILLSNGILNVLLGSPSGELTLGARFGAAALYTSALALPPNQIATSDFDGDGTPDIIVPSALSGQMSVLLNISR